MKIKEEYFFSYPTYESKVPQVPNRIFVYTATLKYASWRAIDAT